MNLVSLTMPFTKRNLIRIMPWGMKTKAKSWTKEKCLKYCIDEGLVIEKSPPIIITSLFKSNYEKRIEHREETKV